MTRRQVPKDKCFCGRVPCECKFQEQVKDIIHEFLLPNWDKGKCCEGDSCNDGKGNCNGSCKEWEKHG